MVMPLPAQRHDADWSMLADRARQADKQARFHKREVSRHRRALRECRAEQAGLEAECERLGIELTYTNGEGKRSHGLTDTGYSDAH